MVFPAQHQVYENPRVEHSLGARLVNYVTSSLLKTQVTKVKEDEESHK